MEAGQNCYSDYGSGSSSNSSTSWPPQDIWSFQQPQRTLDRPVEEKSASYQDLVAGKCTLQDIMKEFQMNGLDTPYTPFEDKIWSNRADGLSGLGPAGAYCRQASWPAPERSPAPRLPRPRSEYLPAPASAPAPAPQAPPVDFNPIEFTSSTPVEGEAPASLTAEQAYLLKSLPNAVLFSLLQDMERLRADLQKRNKKSTVECRFCKNNGERESYFRAHALKDAAGRVTCPVLRAFVCKRCGAHGDSAHTSKYCPLSTHDERMKSTAMMRSVRMASGRRRTSSLAAPPSAADHYMGYADKAAPSVVTDTNMYNTYSLASPLDPLWAALEQKLLL
ncbi:hypothetical protein PYW07_014151 [Mythimna separata]|uniref:Nanos-type domain-containing protein n=1 Tax=Mythimna separata TaxID=271217 RepID=A0AAD8DYS6_MYTSE|nr:hypothetical protein PYW07_014151 [Mythimna separata]